MVFHVGLQAKIKLGRKSLDGRTVFLLSQSGSSLKPYSIFQQHTIVVDSQFYLCLKLMSSCLVLIQTPACLCHSWKGGFRFAIMQSGSCGDAGLERSWKTKESAFLLSLWSKGQSVLAGGDCYCLKEMTVQEMKNPSSLGYTFHSNASINIKSKSKLQIEPTSSCPASLGWENKRSLSAVNNLMHIRKLWFGQNRLNYFDIQ